MYAKTVALSLAAAAVVNADLRLNTNDIPNDCTAICRPVRDLGNICTVNFNFNNGQGNNNSDQVQSELDAQCVCTNNSFDLKSYAGQCNACMQEKVASDQQSKLDGINSIMSICDLPSASGYNTASTSGANTVIVLATRLTASSQLTTTITGGQREATGTSSRNQRSTVTTTFLTSGNGGFPSIATSTIVGGGQTGNAAPGLVAPGSNGLLGAVGAIVAGAFALGAFML